MPSYNDNTKGIPVRAANSQVASYSFGSYRQGEITDSAPQNVIGVETGEAFPANATAGLQFAIKHINNGFPNVPATIALRTLFPAGAPSTVSLSIQLAQRDADGEYFTEATTTNVNGEEIVITGVQANFVRVLLNTATGTTAKTLVAKLLVK